MTVSPQRRILSAQAPNGKVLSNVVVIKNGQPMPCVGELVAIDDSIKEYPICLGTVEIAPAEGGSDFKFPIDVPGYEYDSAKSDISYSHQQIPAFEKDWHTYNPIFNSFIGMSGNITAIFNDIVKIVLDSLKDKLSITAGNIDVLTNHYALHLDNDSGSPTIEVKGILVESGVENNLIMRASMTGDRMAEFIVSSQYGESFSFVLDRNGKVTINNPSGGSINSGQFIASFKSLFLDVESDLIISSKTLEWKLNDLMLNVIGSIVLVAGGKMALTASDEVSVSGNNVQLTAIGNPLSPLPTSKAISIKAVNGSIVISASAGMNPLDQTGVFITSSIPEQIVDNLVSLNNTIGVFHSKPGGIVIGGPLPTPIGINSFVKFNEFAVLMSTLIGALIAFATAQATAASAGAPLLVPGYAALGAALTPVLAAILPCKSIYVTTGEP